MILIFHAAEFKLLFSYRHWYSIKIEKYQLKSDNTLTFFEFISIGSKGKINKVIEFQSTSTPNLYNLAFGDKNVETGELDDLAISNNGDTEKVLGTVVAAVYAFFNKNPGAIIYASGSTPARTRLYRMGIIKFHDEIKNDFLLYGQIGSKLFVFEVGKEYDGFVAQRNFK
ncbi:MAG: hypothetical protein M3R72_08330 [Bacteroidota bacterium]|nr:hypothetical protein [Bacteroidota bacterium]